MRVREVVESPRLHKALRVLLLILAVVFLAQTHRKAARPGGYDFTSYLQSAQALAAGADPYHTGTPFPYIYPLFLAFLLVPLTYVPSAVAVTLWFALGAACLHISLKRSACGAGG